MRKEIVLAVCFFKVLIVFAADAQQDCAHPKIKLQCCDIPIPDFMDVAYSECVSELDEENKSYNIYTKQWCIDDCIFKKSEIFYDGVFNHTAFDDVLETQINDTLSEWHPLFKISFDYCASEAIIQEPELLPITNLPPFDLDNTDCSFVPSFVIKCMMVYMTKACPVQYWFETPECENYKRYLEMCPNQFLPPEYLPKAKANK